jgi:hypothetical protein
MTEIRKRAFVGIVGLVSAGLFSVGCSSSASTTGTGGTTGHAGTSGGTAGTTGTGSAGTTGSGGGTTGTGGSSSTVGCQTSTVPTGATIADFASADGGIELMGGLSNFGGAVSKPTFSIAGGTLSIMDNVVPAAAPQYVGVVLYLNGNAGGTECLDASSYTGIEFDISGSLTAGKACSIQYSTLDSEHSDSTQLNAAGTGPNDPKASGPAGSYSPQLAITVTSTPVTTKVPFGDASLAPGSPSTAIDDTKITGVQWQLTVAGAADGGPSECDLALTIDNIKFY